MIIVESIIAQELLELAGKKVYTNVVCTHPKQGNGWRGILNLSRDLAMNSNTGILIAGQCSKKEVYKDLNDVS